MHFSFLIDVPPTLIPHFLSFNLAVWRFREPAADSHGELSDEWRSSRLAELASTLTPHKPVKKRRNVSSDDSVLEHDAILAASGITDLICYTDGSASPNPGPTGAGACLFNIAESNITDLGLPLGFSTNNVGELVAIGLLLQELLDSFDDSTDRPFRVTLFTDSLYASSAIKSSKAPLAHSSLVLNLRVLFARVSARFTVSIFWIRGHCGAGGNERVDRVAKKFAKLSVGATRCLLPDIFRGVKSIRHFPFELSTAPLNAFLSQLPTASAPVSWGSVMESMSAVSFSPTCVRGGTSTVSFGPPDVSLSGFVNDGLPLSNASDPDNWESDTESKFNVTRDVESSITLSARASDVLVPLCTSTRTHVQLPTTSAPVNWERTNKSQVPFPSFNVPVFTGNINLSTPGSYIMLQCPLPQDACKSSFFPAEDDGLDHKHSD